MPNHPLETELIRFVHHHALSAETVGNLVLMHRAREAKGLAEALRRKEQPGLEEIVAACEERGRVLEEAAKNWSRTLNARA